MDSNLSLAILVEDGQLRSMGIQYTVSVYGIPIGQ